VDKIHCILKSDKVQYLVLRYNNIFAVMQVRNEILPYERIRNLRIDRGLTQKQVAEFLHVKQNTYSQYEIGVLNYPLDVVIRLAKFYGVSVDYLVGLTDNEKPYSRS